AHIQVLSPPLAIAMANTAPVNPTTTTAAATTPTDPSAAVPPPNGSSNVVGTANEAASTAVPPTAASQQSSIDPAAISNVMRLIMRMGAHVVAETHVETSHAPLHRGPKGSGQLSHNP